MNSICEQIKSALEYSEISPHDGKRIVLIENDEVREFIVRYCGSSFSLEKIGPHIVPTIVVRLSDDKTVEIVRSNKIGLYAMA